MEKGLIFVNIEIDYYSELQSLQALYSQTLLTAIVY